MRNVDDHTSEPGSLAPLFLAHTRECNGEIALRVTTSAPSGEGSAGSVETMINTSFGPRSGGAGGHTNPSVLCGRSEIDRFPRADTSERLSDYPDCHTGENFPRASARFEEGTTVRDATQAEMSYGPRSTDTSDWSRIRAHTRERVGENAICTSAAFVEGATVQAAHRVAAAIEEGTTVPAGTQAETCFGRRSADKSVPTGLRSPAHGRECRSEAAPCVTTPVSTLGSPVPRISSHTGECTGESASLGIASVHVETFLSDTSSRAHLSVAAPVFTGASFGQRSGDVCEVSGDTGGRQAEPVAKCTCNMQVATSVISLGATDKTRWKPIRFVKQGAEPLEYTDQSVPAQNLTASHEAQERSTTTRDQGRMGNCSTPQIRVLTYNTMMLKHEGRLTNICAGTSRTPRMSFSCKAPH